MLAVVLVTVPAHAQTHESTDGGNSGLGDAFTSGPSFTSLHSFDGTDGSFPYSGLVQATDGDLYGTTYAGGANDVSCSVGFMSGCGTVFKITPSGTLTTLYSFCSQTNCTDGANPYAGLVQATDGNFYGTTQEGGANDVACGSGGCGTVFKITPTGTLTTLYSFCSQTNCTDGAVPYAGLVQAIDGNLYGTTYSGGTNTDVVCGSSGCGTVFKISPSGTLTTLYSFCSQSGCTDGANPYAGLIQTHSGDLYGTTLSGVSNGVCAPSGCGTVFKITTSGALTTLHTFCLQDDCFLDGALPYAGLVQATNGNLYGTTGFHTTVFVITPGGKETGFASQGTSTAGLVQAGRRLYGTEPGSGVDYGYGAVFKITLDGRLTELHIFEGNDGALPYAGLAQDTNGNFYGTTQEGGASDEGTVFRLSLGLGPFVETRPTSGKVGAVVEILGTNLTGATSVSFNGTAAVFQVAASSEITTAVPAGAKTGNVQVTTPRGTLTSNVQFHVTP
jgi:uncharacterized repeat protein (TIGR03803 family)